MKKTLKRKLKISPAYRDVESYLVNQVLPLLRSCAEAGDEIAISMENGSEETIGPCDTLITRRPSGAYTITITVNGGAVHRCL